jgi:hypothetical protein
MLKKVKAMLKLSQNIWMQWYYALDLRQWCTKKYTSLL